MQLKVPIRKVETFVTDDGRKIEKLTFVKNVKTEINTQNAIEFNNTDVMFYGYSPLDENIDRPVSLDGNNIKFPITGVSTIEEAFDRYIQIWTKVSEILDKQMDQYKAQLSQEHEKEMIKNEGT